MPENEPTADRSRGLDYAKTKLLNSVCVCPGDTLSRRAADEKRRFDTVGLRFFQDFCFYRWRAVYLDRCDKVEPSRAQWMLYASRL